jgi:hypothetical protein
MQPTTHMPIQVQGCQMVCFQNKTASFGTVWKPFERKISISLTIIWYTLWPFALLHGNLVNVWAIR